MYGNGLMHLVATGVRHSPHIQGNEYNGYASGVETTQLIKSENDELTYSANIIESVIKKGDLFSINHIRVDYEMTDVGPGTGHIDDILKCYAIKCDKVKHVWGDIEDRLMLTGDMMFFKETCDDYVKKYENSAVFNTYFDYMCPNGIFRNFFKDIDTVTFKLKLNKVDGIKIKAIYIISNLCLLDSEYRRKLYIDYNTKNINIKTPEQTQYNKLYGNKYICNRTHVCCAPHNNTSENSFNKTFIRINGICNGFFIKTNNTIQLNKINIKSNGQDIIVLNDKVDIGTYTIRFGEWIYIPFDTYKRNFKEIKDCFYFNANGAPDLSRIDSMKVIITADTDIMFVDFMFPLHLAMCIYHFFGEVTPINIMKENGFQLCGCYPAEMKYDRFNYFNFEENI